ncbi:hypothetical protein MKZ38_004788 [Zalerion maritima]|uniref:Uncharacterized protein n=1 Tax=Zalerion maritima TaxID=339359 RepID=A0AAD5RLZ6_9PEZI|nr:hypothetical protein MKZ38_004788 [Zalerion maritima]
MRFIGQTGPPLAAPNGHVPPSPCSPASSSQTTLYPQVLALGMPRCATSSLQAALEHLGHGPCLHMAHVLPYPERERIAIAAMREKSSPEKRRKLLYRLCAGFGATVDYPGIVFADYLLDRELYDWHNDWVRREAKMEFRAEDGWVLLCEWLGKEIPGRGWISRI